MTTRPHAPSDAAPDARLDLLRTWLAGLPPAHGLDPDSARPASDDASFRRYFRVNGAGPAGSLIAMDAPPALEDCRPFLHAATVLAQAGMRVPRVLASDLSQGFLLLDDFGDRTYRAALDAENPDLLYADASRALVALQSASQTGVFPEYDRELLHRELALYPEWYIGRHKGVTLDTSETETLHHAFETLLASNLAQPRVYVHRDYHCRNLMRLEDDANPGVLDFQDAVHGPITYDLVSLLRDAYIDWPEERVIDWTVRHWERARKANLPVPADFSEFYRDFEWMGLQRHLKVLGIFARLCHRDGKPRYVDDMPRVLGYVVRTANRYNAFSGLMKLIDRIEGRENVVGYTF